MSDLPPPPPPPPPGSGQPQPPSSGGYPAGPDPVGAWPRLGARIIDWLVLLIPGILVTAVIGGGTAPFTGEASAATFAAGILMTGVEFAYFVWLESTRGQTLGKMALGYRVVGPTGAHPTTEEAARRNAWMLLSIVPFLGDLVVVVFYIVIGVTISSDSFRRGWHDNFAGGTAVVRAR